MIDTKPLKKTFKRRRCQNCHNLYMPTREDQKFCRTLPDRDKCRKEFYRYGSSYGPLKTGLERAIEKKYAALEKEMSARFKALSSVVVDHGRRLDEIEGVVCFSVFAGTTRITSI